MWNNKTQDTKDSIKHMYVCSFLKRADLREKQCLFADHNNSHNIYIYIYICIYIYIYT